jgi:HlyD family secretion protein
MSHRRRMAGLVAVVTVLAAFTYGLAHFRESLGEPADDLWTETVKRGPMLWDVRGAGTLVRARNPAKLIARVTVLDSMAGELRLNQKADVDSRKVIMKGQVSYISRSPANGMRSVDIALRSPLPEGVGENLQVDATIHLGALENVLYVGRPVHAHQNSSAPIFKLVDGGQHAVRVLVKFGHASVNTIEILDGLNEGDQIIPSDMSAWDNFDQIRLR